ncbi:orotate phosphoribosyltransferase, partial [Anoxybacillus sp. LAT_38]|nr:orotate phosphoribosyltransferase [Anoxybacillus sp. LAT_38]
KAVQSEGGDVLGVAAIFSYQFPEAEALFTEEGISVTTLSHYTALLETARERGVITAEQESLLADWRKAPRTFFG